MAEVPPPEAPREAAPTGADMERLREMATKGYRKAKAKEAYISQAWEAAKPKMIEGYRATPFGPTRKSNYEKAIRVAKHRQDWEKWYREWIREMSK